MPNINGLPYPALSDPNNPPADFLALATAVNTRFGTHTHSGSQIVSGTVSADRLPNLESLNGTLGLSNGGTGAATVAGAQLNLKVGLVNLAGTAAVAGAGASYYIDPTGRIVFVDATSLSVNDIFVTGYSTYRIVLRMRHSASSATFFRLRVNGVDATSANYTDAFHVVTPTTTLRVYHAAAVAAEIEYGATGGFTSLNVYDLNNPESAVFTQGTRQSTYVGVSGMEVATGGFYHNVNTAYDGFTIYPGTGNISGTIQVFGYND